MSLENRQDDGMLEALRSPVVNRARKNAHALIRRAEKANAGSLDNGEFRDLLGGMKTQELQIFWFFFSADLAFSQAQSVPYWKTRQHKKAFETTSALLAYYPTEKDSSGKYVVDRNALEAHIVAQLNNHVRVNCELLIADSRLPFLVKAHNRIGISVAIGKYLLVALGFLCLIIPPARTFAASFAVLPLGAFFLLWLSYLFLSLWRAVVHH